jgi:hypothetical protein
MSQVRWSICRRHGAVALATLLSLAGVAPGQGGAALSEAPPAVRGTSIPAAVAPGAPSPISDTALRQILARCRSEYPMALRDGLTAAPFPLDRAPVPGVGSGATSWEGAPRSPFEVRVGGWVQLDATFGSFSRLR